MPSCDVNVKGLCGTVAEDTTLRFSLSSTFFSTATGVFEGVLVALSSRVLRDPDLGVMLRFINVDTGVVMSFLTAAGLGTSTSLRAPLRPSGVVAGEFCVVGAIRGVNGVRVAPLLLALSVGRKGRFPPYVLSGGMLDAGGSGFFTDSERACIRIEAF